MSELINLKLPSIFVGQLVDGLEILIEQWEYTADHLEHGAFRQDMMIRECSDGHEARTIAEFYREISKSIIKQKPDVLSA